MARYLLESSATDGYLLEDGSGVLLLEGVAGIDLTPAPVAVATAVPTPVVGAGAEEIVLAPLPVAVVVTLARPVVVAVTPEPPEPPPPGPGQPDLAVEATITGSDRPAKGGTVTLAKTLYEHYSGFYGCTGQEAYGEHVILGWKSDSDGNLPAGFFPEPWMGPLEPEPYLVGTSCVYRGFRMTANAVVSVSHNGGGAGVAGGPDTVFFTVSIRKNGDVVYQETQTDPAPGGLHYWGATFEILVTDLAVSTGDLLEVTVHFGGSWAGFEYYATYPSSRNHETHFAVYGDTLPGKPFLRASVVNATPS